ncbi:DUF3140 domain-containing protein [Aquipuribacter hungaricus]|uniref:DUF3140 domain-containing protein n=1 Tax=Aquipuribacter hungaricus TaxID=545624 RepID=A0ABV7WJ73_9MICO
MQHDLTDTELDELWDEFHTVVNMTSRELGDWLRVRAADEVGEALPDRAGTETGQHVLRLLGKRKTDVDADDVALMQRVVDRVRSERREDLEPTAGEAHWRHRLMTVGHDPLKPVGETTDRRAD